MSIDGMGLVSVSGALRGQMASVKFSLVHRNGLDAGVEDSTQIRLLGGIRLLQDRLRFNVETSYNADPGESGNHFPEQHCPPPPEPS